MDTKIQPLKLNITANNEFKKLIEPSLIKEIAQKDIKDVLTVRKKTKIEKFIAVSNKLANFMNQPKVKKPLSTINDAFRAWIRANYAATTGLSPDLIDLKLKASANFAKISEDYLLNVILKAKKCIPRIK